MARKVFWLLSVSLASVALLAAAGCGGNSSSSSTTTTESTEIEDTTTEDTTTEETEVEGSETDEMTTTDMGDVDLSGIASADDCRELGELSATLSSAFSGTEATDGEAYAQFLDEFAARAPEAIRDDFEVVAENYAKIADALGDYDATSGVPPTAEELAKLQAAVADVDQTALAQASTNIATWVSQNCTGG